MRRGMSLLTVLGLAVLLACLDRLPAQFILKKDQPPLPLDAAMRGQVIEKLLKELDDAARPAAAARRALRVAVALPGCLLPDPWRAESQEGTDRPPPPRGRLIDVGGYRLHLHCTGKGDPTVVLVAGGGEFSFDWELVQSKVAAFARVCSYDRAGEAWSDLGPTPRTMRQEVYELHALLQKAGRKGPFVLVGQSMGGLLVRLYAQAYPQEVAGVVLVDPTHESTRLSYRGKLVRMREQAKGKPVPPVQTMKTSPPRTPSPEEVKEAEKWAKVFGPPTIRPPYDQEPAEVQRLRLWFLAHPKRAARGEDYWAEELQQMHEARQKNARPLGNLPLVVLAAGKKAGKAPPEVSEEVWKQVLEEKRRQREDLATLSQNSALVFDPQSGHHIHLDHPELVVAAVREVIGAAAERRKVSRSRLVKSSN